LVTATASTLIDRPKAVLPAPVQEAQAECSCGKNSALVP
jgi:hypothetical protein